jgi:hypothetical protein
MITAIEIENFMAIGERVRVELKPLMPFAWRVQIEVKR